MGTGAVLEHGCQGWFLHAVRIRLPGNQSRTSLSVRAGSDPAEVLGDVAVGRLRLEVRAGNAVGLVLGALRRYLPQGVDHEGPDVGVLNRVIHPHEYGSLAGQANAPLVTGSRGSSNAHLCYPERRCVVVEAIADPPQDVEVR